MSESKLEQAQIEQPSRRTALRLAGGGALAALTMAGVSRRAQAQEASPAAGNGSKVGAHVVTRTRIVKADASIDELNAAISDGLAPIVHAIAGYIDYYVVMNFETRERTAVSIFADRAGTEESTRQAAEYLSGFSDYYEDLDPVILEGEIVVEAG